MRMRVVKADDLVVRRPRAAARRDVILRIDEKPVWIGGEICGTDRFENNVAAADEDPATFRRPRFQSVSDDVINNAPVNPMNRNLDLCQPSKTRISTFNC